MCRNERHRDVPPRALVCRVTDSRKARCCVIAHHCCSDCTFVLYLHVRTHSPLSRASRALKVRRFDHARQHARHRNQKAGRGQWSSGSAAELAFGAASSRNVSQGRKWACERVVPVVKPARQICLRASTQYASSKRASDEGLIRVWPLVAEQSSLPRLADLHSCISSRASALICAFRYVANWLRSCRLDSTLVPAYSRGMTLALWSAAPLLSGGARTAPARMPCCVT